MAGSFKPIEHKKIEWDEKTFSTKMQQVANADLSGRKVKLKKDLTIKEANFLQKLIWPIFKNSETLRRWFLGVNVKSNHDLLQKMGDFIKNSELKDDPTVVNLYNDAIKNYTAFLTKNISKKTADKYAFSPISSKAGNPPPKGFKSLKEVLKKHLEDNRTAYGRLAGQRFDKIFTDFDNALDLDDFLKRLAQDPNRIFDDKIEAIKQALKPGQPDDQKNDAIYTPLANRGYPFGPATQQKLRNKAADYPDQGYIKIKPQSRAPLLMAEDDFKHIYDQIHNMDDYEEAFHAETKGEMKLRDNPYPFNIHERNFQDLALRLIQQERGGYRKLIERLDVKKDKAKLQLLRARNYAIASREDLGWDGKQLRGQEAVAEKKKKMEKNWDSLVLNDWAGYSDHDFQSRSQPGPFDRTKVSTNDKDTLAAVEMLSKTNDPSKIAWVMMANSYCVGGGYQQGDTAQEEMTTTNCDAIVTLSHASQIIRGGRNAGRTAYQQGRHIPPGGNYFHQTTLFNTESGSPITTNCIVHAFADFRKRNYSERADYAIGDQLDYNSQKYVDRIKLDMRGVLRTAKGEGQEVLVLSATGCGAFQHDADAEAKAWGEVLQENEFQGHFREIVFAIKNDGRNADNINAFITLSRKIFLDGL